MKQKIPEILYTRIHKYQEGQLILDPEKEGHLLFEENDKHLEKYRDLEDFSIRKVKTDTLKNCDYLESEKCWRTLVVTIGNFA